MDETRETLPSSKGTYSLIMRISETTQLTVGKLGTYEFRDGWYTYVGSALGSGGLRARLGHHLSSATKPHWHIDYLRMAASIREVWYVVSETAYEHRWANELLSRPGAEIPVRCFGASDCTCVTHLIRFRQRPDLEAFSKALGYDVVRCEVKP